MGRLLYVGEGSDIVQGAGMHLIGGSADSLPPWLQLNDQTSDSARLTRLFSGMMRQNSELGRPLLCSSSSSCMLHCNQWCAAASLLKLDQGEYYTHDKLQCRVRGLVPHQVKCHINWCHLIWCHNIY